MNATRLEAGITETLSRLANEAAVAAAAAYRNGEKATIVKYSTGLEMLRFSTPFGKYGMHYEVPPHVWDDIEKNNGKIIV